MKRSNLKVISMASLCTSVSAAAALVTANIAMADELESCHTGAECRVILSDQYVYGHCGDSEEGCACWVPVPQSEETVPIYSEVFCNS